MDLKENINLALGNEPVDLLLKNGKLVNVFSGSIHHCPVAISGDQIIGFGKYNARRVVDLDGAFVAPGFIDGHIHLESSMLTIPEFARNVVPLGTTGVVTDPHEIANVYGLAGIKYILDSSEGLPIRVSVMFPSCVPATPFETSGAILGPDDMTSFRENPRILGLAEVMNFPGVIFMDPDILKKINVFKNKVIDGHAPGLSGKDLTAYKIAGIGSDHECCDLQEAREKLDIGMRIMIREGSAAKNLDSLYPLINTHNSRNIMLVCDDLHPDDILEKGHLNYLLQKIRAKGLDPLTAIQMVTINPATYFGLANVGAILPGYKADLVILEDLESFKAKAVYFGGQLVSEQGRFVYDFHGLTAPKLPESFHIAWEKMTDFKVAVDGPYVNVIEVIPEQIVTRKRVEKTPTVGGMLNSDPQRDLLKIAVIERHHGSGAYAVGMIKGFGLKAGAIASSVAHDSHNIIVVGVNDADMLLAARTVSDMGGGLAVVANEQTRASLPLRIGGLMSELPINEVKNRLTECERATHALGCALNRPFATLSFMALTPIPEIKITDQGLFDSVNFKFISLFEKS
ncbi:MAG: adenine deaminase [Desulfomonilaceae bacterium]